MKATLRALLPLLVACLVASAALAQGETPEPRAGEKILTP